MRLGIRAQLLFALAALLLLALGPLFFAVASLARASLVRSAEDHARELGRAVAAQVDEAQRHRPEAGLRALLEARVGGEVGAVGIYETGGFLRLEAGEARSALPRMAPEEPEIAVATSRGAALVVVIPSAQGAVATLVHTDPGRLPFGPLVRLVALYVGLLGLALLIFAYFVLTRIVVAPIERLQRAAARVAEGGRELSAPRNGARELVELGASLATMTASLRAEEEQLKARLEELEQAKSELETAHATVIRGEKLASVGRLAAGLAHEIGNPLTAILSLQELLLESGADGAEPDAPGLDEESRELVLRMKRETERVQRILRDLLDFARPASLDATTASAREVIEQVAALVGPQRNLRQVALRIAVAPDLPALRIAPEHLEQVLLNLLLNAADAVPCPGGVISVVARAVGAAVRIEVEDNGGGIALSVRDRLFEPFVTTKEVGQGTGLGLAVCRGLIEAAGGTIHAEEGPEGARFVVELPAAGGEKAPQSSI